MSTLRSTRDLRPVDEPGDVTYLRRVGEVLEVRCGRAVRRVPLGGPGGARSLATFQYHHDGGRGTGYERYGLVVLGERGVPLAALVRAMSPMWDQVEVDAFAHRWGLAIRTHHFGSEAGFEKEYPKLARVTVGGGGMASGCLFSAVVVVAALGGAFGGIAGLRWLADALGIAGWPGMLAVAGIGGIVVGGVGALFLGFVAVDLARRVVRGVRAVVSRDGALRPRPRRGTVRLALEDGELVAYGTRGRRLVLEPGASVLAPADGALLVTGRDGVAEVLVDCPFDAAEVADFGTRCGVPVGAWVAEPERVADGLEERARIEPGEPAGFFTVTVGATLLAGLAYVPVMAGVVSLLGLVIPAAVVNFLAIFIMIVPLPVLGPFMYRWLSRLGGRRRRRVAA